MMTKTLIRKHILLVLLIGLLLTTIISACSVIFISDKMFGSARVINYTGIVRGATQRLVKLELTGNPNDTLMTSLSQILKELQTEDEGEYSLKKLPDESFQNSLVKLEGIWEELQAEIKLTRLHGFEHTRILEVSELHFQVADETVSLAEYYSDELLKQYTIGKNTLICATVLLLAVMLFLGYQLQLLNRENKRITKNAHIDVHTGLPNKSKFEQKCQSYGILDTGVRYGLIVFDLNNLKQTNDMLGHHTGDDLILNFADILQKNLSKNAFAARCGGDEFTIVYNTTTNSQLQSYIDRVKSDVAQFNSENNSYQISFAVGYSLSAFEENITLHNLFEEADQNMYHDKQLSKERDMTIKTQ